MIKRLEVDALLFMIVGAFVGMFLVAYVKNQPVQFHSNAFVDKTPTITPTPTVTFEPTTTSDSQISSDGTHKVVLRTTNNEDLSKSYELATSDNGPAIFSTTLSAGQNITLPFNAWEPQNRYFFIQENLASGTNILVFKGDGSPFADGEAYLDLSDAFKHYGSPYTYDAATGWAGYNIIVINTKATDGSQGASYWYEVPYGSILPLATKF
jgi:hypothetical protein